HTTVDVVSDGSGHYGPIQPQHSADGDAKTDVDVGGGQDFFGGWQRGGVAKLADGIRFEGDGFGGENGRIGNHLADSLHTQAKGVYANKFGGWVGHE
ncbi:MAG: hypothetical protein NTX52_10360, partial [Planctomycetota bacterium]|nr:hypothetical protein [Planctomycetota bacterium]